MKTMNIYIYIRKKNFTLFSIDMRVLFLSRNRGCYSWYQSPGCYSGDRNDYMILKCVFRMVRTRQGARTDPSPVWESDQSFQNESDPDWDPLADTSSHIPATSVYFEAGESVRLQDDSLSRQADVSMPPSDRWGEIIYTHQWNR
jgi:hypothetical protein